MIEWAPDGRSIYFLAAEAKTEEEKAREEKKDDVAAFDEDYKQRHLWKVVLDDRSTVLPRRSSTIRTRARCGS